MWALHSWKNMVNSLLVMSTLFVRYFLTMSFDRSITSPVRVVILNLLSSAGAGWLIAFSFAIFLNLLH